MLTKTFFNRETNVNAFFCGYGSFGEITGDVNRTANTVYQETDSYRITCTYDIDPYGVISRKDTFQNISDQPLMLHSLHSRFVFEGGEYDVYTQFNSWQNESCGLWQPLVTSVSAVGASSRTCQDAAPMLALWSMQQQRGCVFHLVPNSAWEMKVTRAGHYCKYTKIVVELGIRDYNFDVTLAPGEILSMPEIICYSAMNKTDLDCYKLHNYMHTKYPRRELPMIYDTWMYRFDHINYENVASQIPLAAQLGIEYFFIDAGWFGKGKSWSQSVGDWSENMTGGFCGRMIDIANEVRAAGMKFGIWLEPERADPLSDSVREHPEYYIKGDVESEFYFLDFANEKAREWMLNVIFDLVDRYGVEYIKDDYNADMYFDVYHTSYMKYHDGHKKFMDAIRAKYPNLYLSSCASGGERMDLASYMKFDSTWPSDNESPYVEMRIYRDSILRLPPQGFERWVVAHSLEAYQSFYTSFSGYNSDNTDRLICSGDAIWKHVEGVQLSYLKGYTSGGPIGFSCDLSLLSPKVFGEMKEHIAKIKEKRDFWRTAVARILCDTPSVTIYQYSDMALKTVVIQLFTQQTKQDHFCIIPKLDPQRLYKVNGNQVLSGAELMEEGIEVSTPEWFDNWHEMLEVTLEVVE